MTFLEEAIAFGPDQPQRFLAAWLGPPERDAPALASGGLPAALVEWHRQVSRWDRPVTRQNRVPERRQIDHEHGDMLLVGIENQSVWLWGVREEDGDNPPVWERETDWRDDWTPTGEPLDEFLWQFTLTEAVFGPDLGIAVNDIGSTNLGLFMQGWTRINAKSWRWPSPNTLWTRGGMIAWTAVNDRSGAPVRDVSTYCIFVGARSNDDIVGVDDAGIEWNWDSYHGDAPSRDARRPCAYGAEGPVFGRLVVS